jgi:two-component system sensor histidine kinase PrrB
VTAPGSLRARIALAAVAALALTGLMVGAVLLQAIERDGRDALDDSLRERVERIGPGPRGGPGGFGPGPGGFGDFGGPRGPRDEQLLAGSGTFVQVAIGDQLVDRRGDVPAGAPGVPAAEGLATIDIGGEPWRSITAREGPGGEVRVQVLSTLQPVEERVGRIRRLVVLLGLVALVLTGAAAWAFTTVAVRPLARLRAGAARVSGAQDLAQALPEDEGPDEVRSLARDLNAMLARLRASTDALEQALLATRRFASDAGHELRTPLTGLRATLDTLERNEDLPAAERRALLREMQAEQERIVHLLEGLQALARGEAAESLPREAVEVADLVDAAVYAARRRHPATTFAFADDGAQDAVVEGWPEGLRLVCDNLLDNAALHGGHEVRAGLLAEDGRLVLRVADDGPGVPAAERDRVLEPFARGTRATARGTGLGLAIVAQQVGLHGGTIRLGDGPLGGLLVEVALPAAQVETGTAARARASASAASGASPSKRSP